MRKLLIDDTVAPKPAKKMTKLEKAIRDKVANEVPGFDQSRLIVDCGLIKSKPAKKKAKKKAPALTRKGVKLAVLGDGHPRRMADGKNAYRKMSPEQRTAFIAWMADSGLPCVRD
jgi:hypothetical protein